MKNTFKVIGLLISSILMMSCQEGKQESISTLGTEVNFIRKGEGGLLETNRVLLMNFRYQTDSGVVLSESKEGDLLPLLYTRDTSDINGQFQSVLNMLSVGDSVTFKIPASDLFQKTFRQAVPPNIGAESILEFELGVVQQMTREEYADYNNRKVEEYNLDRLEVEKGILNDYLKEKGVTPTISESGLHYVINQSGQGPTPENGQTVTVKYRGTLLDGSQFDQGQYTFELGKGEVIKGWDEGIGYLNTGAQGVLYIPSTLAYGRRGGGTIPPDSPLVFEVELIEIK